MKTLIVIAGPTASGKTSLSIKLAQHFQSEIISADSRQFYRQMNIGTAKPLKVELRRVQHHFIDSLDVMDTYNVGRFEEEAINKIEELFGKKDILFMTGGSGLYIDAVCKGIDAFPESDPEFRRELNDLLNTKGIVALQELLKERDPEYYGEVDLNNPHRIIRALEVQQASGKQFSSLRRGNKKNRNFIIKKIGLLIDREELYARINSRVDKMMSDGLVEEVRSLLPYRNSNAMQTVGYKEIIDFINGTFTLDEAIEAIKQNTRNYAKRQMTWFRRDAEIRWFDPSEFEKILGYIEE